MNATLWRLRLGNSYFQNWGETWLGDWEAALKIRWALGRTGVAIYTLVTDCPNHAGAFDCSPFCELCEGTQEMTEIQTNAAGTAEKEKGNV